MLGKIARRVVLMRRQMILIFAVLTVVSACLIGKTVINYDFTDYLGVDTVTRKSLDMMEKEERRRVVHASRRPLWHALLLWLWVGICFGIGAGVAAFLVRGAFALFDLTALAPLAPLWIGLACGGVTFVAMLVLTLLGRRKL